MMFDYPSQRFQDWLCQRWVMARGRRIDPAENEWLMGPFGNVDVVADNYVQRLAEDEDLRIDPSEPNAGLFENLEALGLSSDHTNRIHPTIRDFYLHTARYELDAWCEWSRLFRPAGFMMGSLYGRRMQQLNIPTRPLDTAAGLQSRIIQLREKESGAVRYTVWHRQLKSTGDIVFSGIYGAGSLPNGAQCLKAVFPLPRGNATVFLRHEIGPDGSFDLIADGKRFGDGGLYFLLTDRKGRIWSQYVSRLHETLSNYVDNDGVMRTNHDSYYWGRRVFHVHYRIHGPRDRDRYDA